GWPALTDLAQPWGHWQQGGKLAPNDPHGKYHLPAAIAPAGDLSLSIGDYARFVQLHLRGLAGLPPLVDAQQAQALPLLTAALIHRLHQPVGDYSCGWLEQRFAGAPDSAHEGD